MKDKNEKLKIITAAITNVLAVNYGKPIKDFSGNTKPVKKASVSHTYYNRALIKKLNKV